MLLTLYVRVCQAIHMGAIYIYIGLEHVARVQRRTGGFELPGSRLVTRNFW